ncbi:MAG TPA: helicase-related protein, partial [Chitinophagaceae bacterium]|nr:helicase-related protein [Chitinophagaceae bacterium]
WGQDFRVDYLYIGDFIKNLQELKGPDTSIPVSCFTATAKQKVIEDIRQYFQEKLGLNLTLYRAISGRKNLQYEVFKKDTDEEKYAQLRDLIETRNCPTIVYVSRTKRAYKLATRLTEDGLVAKAYHGKMDKEEKTANQNAFMAGEVNIMVATSAFGMGVDKDNVGLVIHYDISDSLENYVQEAGRAGRDEKINAECQILFSEDDLDKHFILLNQTKITVKEINQIWKAIKHLTRVKERVSNSALEIARQAGWDEGVTDMETRVHTAIAALEGAGYIRRGQNMPRVYANSILSANAQEAIDKINQSQRIDLNLKEDAIRIIKKLFSSKSKRLSTDEAAESRVDYISDQLGIVKDKVIRIIELLRQEEILAQTKDLTAFIRKGENAKQSLGVADSFRLIESLLLDALQDNEHTYHLKELNEKIIEAGAGKSTPAKIKTIINFWAVKNWIKKHYPEGSKNHVKITPALPVADIRAKLEKRLQLAKSIVEYLFQKAAENKDKTEAEQVLVEFSVLELKEQFENNNRLFNEKASIDEVEDALFYLSRIDAIKIEGGFLVIHNKLSIERLEANNLIRYKESDYRKLDEFYKQKVQQIHIVGEYARKMIKNYNEALRFVDDYFTMNYPAFLQKYFPGSRETEIKRTLTPEKFKKLFGSLSVNQLAIINDREQHIVVAAGPGSGKTRLLVHKLAS